MTPKKYSPKWMGILAGYTALVFGTLYFAQTILKTEMTTKSIIAFLIIAVGSGAIATLGGFLGAKKYFVTCTLGILAGLIYMLYIAIFNVSPGWGDLTSIVSYFVFATAGVILGVVVELVMFILNKRK